MTATLLRAEPHPPAAPPATPAIELDRLPEPARLLDQLGDPLDPDRYHWAWADAAPITADEAFCLTYAAQVEWGTEGAFASLDISDDPVVQRFLRTWLAQEVVHAELLAHLVQRTTGAEVPPLHRTLRQRFAAERGRWVNVAARRLVGEDFFALHMTWGAVNELTTLRFYRVLCDRTEHPLVAEVLHDLIKQEAAHYAFYRNLAARRLGASERAQRMVRWALEHRWRPVGSGLRSEADVERISQLAFGDRPDIVRQMDAQLERLPGLDGLGLFQRRLAA